MKPIHRTALASAIALGLAAPAYAAPQGDATELEQIVVTGTRAKDRTVLESAVPIDVITREDLRRAGAVGQELGQVLQNLLPTFNFPRQSNSGGADHVRAGQLRGMSPDQVLVLVNGKRRHTSAIVNLEAKIGKGTNPVDFNSIPLGAIARIEVLRDGAGAQYGSDAIAGVINVILDDAPTGGEVGFTYGAHRTDFEPTDDTLSDGQTRSFDAEIGIPLSERGFLRIGFDYTDRAQTERGGPDGIPFFEQQTPANLALAGRVSYRPGDPAVTAYNGWFNGLFPVGEAFDLYAFGTYNDRESEGAAFFRYPDSSQNFRSVYPQGYRPFTTGDNSDLAATVGARGSGSAWSWDASLGFGRNAFDFGVANSLNASLGPTSPTRFDLGRFVFDQLTANLDATRDIAFGDAGPLLLAVGGELRRETYDTRAGDPASYAAGPLTDRPVGAQAGPGLSPADEAESSRTVVGAYADLSGNLTERLFGGAALRYDRYNDFGDAVTGKLSGRYEIAPGYAIRGALSNNFRAPSLAQNSFNFTVTSFGSGGQLRRVRTLAPTNPIAQALGAQELDAETSRNVSLGFTAQPLDGLHARRRPGRFVAHRGRQRRPHRDRCVHLRQDHPARRARQPAAAGRAWLRRHAVRRRGAQHPARCRTAPARGGLGDLGQRRLDRARPGHAPRQHHPRVQLRRRLRAGTDLRREVPAGRRSRVPLRQPGLAGDRRQQPDRRVPGPVQRRHQLLRQPAVRRALADRLQRRVLVRPRALRLRLRPCVRAGLARPDAVNQASGLALAFALALRGRAGLRAALRPDFRAGLRPGLPRRASAGFSAASGAAPPAPSRRAWISRLPTPRRAASAASCSRRGVAFLASQF